jgi:hypothetical protein
MTALETHAHLRAENRIRIGWNPHFDAPPPPKPPRPPPPPPGAPAASVAAMILFCKRG